MNPILNFISNEWPVDNLSKDPTGNYDLTTEKAKMVAGLTFSVLLLFSTCYLTLKCFIKLIKPTPYPEDFSYHNLLTPTYPLVEGDLPPPPERITVGCINVGHISCWLIASLNLMAATNHFDSLLNLDFPPEHEGEPEELKNLRQTVPYLKIAVNNLRTGKKTDALLINLLLRKIGNVAYVMGQNNRVDMNTHQDPAEFLDRLLSDWNSFALNYHTPPPVRPLILTKYIPINHHQIKGEIREVATEIVNANINEDYLDPKTAIHLNRAIKTTDILNFEISNGDFLPFRKIDHLDRSNTRLIVSVKRNQSGKTVVNPIEIDNDGNVTLRKQKYHVVGCFIHRGDQNFGHWFYIEANQNGKYYSHNDHIVSEITSKNSNSSLLGIESMKYGTIFFLEKIQV